jgi:hypothetical protein
LAPNALCADHLDMDASTLSTLNTPAAQAQTAMLAQLVQVQQLEQHGKAIAQEVSADLGATAGTQAPGTYQTYA